MCLLITGTSALWYSAEYSTFSISNEAGNYQLTVDGYSGDAGYALRNSGTNWNVNGRPFSTADRDNDSCNAINCAANNGGAWWMACCSRSELNGDGMRMWSDASAIDVTDSRMLIKKRQNSY